MYFRSSFLPLAGVAFFATQSVAQDCLSYGIDFVEGGSYFINSNSNASFTAVTQFSGCQNDTADVILVDPNENEYQCTNIPLEPDYTSEISTCPIEKEDMFSGDWSLLIISNNGDGNPIAYERDFTLSVGPQQTVTATPTVQFNKTTTQTLTTTTTQYVLQNITVTPHTTVTVPSATAIVTVTPKPTKKTLTTILTRTLKTWTVTSIITTVTKTASCTVPPRPQQPDPTCHIHPDVIQLPAGLDIPRKRDSALDLSTPAGRLAGIKARRAAGIDKRDIVKRSADAPTVTVTESSVTVTTTATFNNPTTSTVLDVVVATKTITTTLPIKTVHSGKATRTTTAAQRTSTFYRVSTTYVWSTRTMTAAYTSTKTLLPSASVTACKKLGGNFGHVLIPGGW